MGCVYEAVQINLARVVALKVSEERGTSGVEGGGTVYRERFLREAQLATQIKHPHVVGVLDYGQTAQCLYIAYQKVDGPTLSGRLREKGPLDPREVLPLFAALLEGLAAIHDHGIIHRDIKPGNILLEGSHPFITDLGIAADKDGERLTAANKTVGTPAYMAPEQIQGQPVGPPADLYAMGCVLFEMLCGTPPYIGKPMALLQSHLRAVIPRLEPRRPGLNPGWNRLTQRALAKEPDARFQTADEFRAELVDLGDILTGKRKPPPILETPAEGFVAPPLQEVTLPRLETPVARSSRRRKRTTQLAFVLAVLVTASLLAVWLLPRKPAPLAAIPANLPGPTASVAPASPPGTATSDRIALQLARFADVTSITTTEVVVYGAETSPEVTPELAPVWGKIHERAVGFPLASTEIAVAILILDPDALESLEMITAVPVQLLAVGPDIVDNLINSSELSRRNRLQPHLLGAGLNLMILRRGSAGGPALPELRMKWKRDSRPRPPDLLEVEPSFRPAIAKVVARMQSERWPQVEQDLMQLVTAEPDLLEAHHLLALSRTTMARVQWQAGRAFTLDFIAGGYLKQGRTGSPLEVNVAGAIEAIHRVLAARPGEGRTWSLLGLLLTELGMLDSGVVALEHACRLAPRDPATWERLGESYEAIPYRMLARRKIDPALESGEPIPAAVRPGVGPEKIRDLCEFNRIASDLYLEGGDTKGAERCAERLRHLELALTKITSDSPAPPR